MNSVNTHYSLGKTMFVLQTLQNIAILGKLNIVHSFEISWLVCMLSFIHLHISKHAKVKKQSTKKTKEAQIFYLKEI